ncbi:MAG: L-histidine N(alpha)-methyltransferase [Chromatiales bacterium]|nr:L-histidine N(alpha)-methyltransferase [Chromatiales bacterium]
MLDLEPRSGMDAAEVLDGLRQPQKQLQPKYFYDEAGSKLFERICDLPEYYPTRTELAIITDSANAMADCVGPSAVLIEPGAGSSRKTRLLLDSLRTPAAYVPIDISRDFLLASAAELAADYPQVEILPVCADFSGALTLPEPSVPALRNVIYFPGSTIGNFTQDQAAELLTRLRELAGARGGLLIGVDLLKSPEILEPAYNDSAGITAAFNMNVLARCNRELGADFRLNAFRHQAVFDREAGRIEMRLVSLADQQVMVAGEAFSFSRDEHIVTEYSHKYSLEGFATLAARAGFVREQVWTDPQDLFSVQYLVSA